MSEIIDAYLLLQLNRNRQDIANRKAAMEQQTQQHAQKLIQEEKDAKAKAEAKRNASQHQPEQRFNLLKFKTQMEALEKADDCTKYSEIDALEKRLEDDCVRFAPDINNFVYDQVQNLQTRMLALRQAWQPRLDAHLKNISAELAARAKNRGKW